MSFLDELKHRAKSLAGDVADEVSAAAGRLKEMENEGLSEAGEKMAGVKEGAKTAGENAGRDVAERTKNMAGSLSEKKDDVLARGSDAADGVEHKAEDVVQTSGEKVDSLVNRAKRETGSDQKR